MVMSKLLSSFQKILLILLISIGSGHLTACSSGGGSSSEEEEGSGSQSAPEDTDDDGDGYTENEGDCDDTNADIHPGAVEASGDSIDQDCDGTNDPTSTDTYTDADGDGYISTVDCNDNDASINPGADDTTVDGTDQNCDGTDGTGETPAAVVDDPDEDDETEEAAEDPDLNIIDIPESIVGKPTDPLHQNDYVVIDITKNIPDSVLAQMDQAKHGEYADFDWTQFATDQCIWCDDRDDELTTKNEFVVNPDFMGTIRTDTAGQEDELLNTKDYFNTTVIDANEYIHGNQNNAATYQHNFQIGQTISTHEFNTHMDSKNTMDYAVATPAVTGLQQIQSNTVQAITDNLIASGAVTSFVIQNNHQSYVINVKPDLISSGQLQVGINDSLLAGAKTSTLKVFQVLADGSLASVNYQFNNKSTQNNVLTLVNIKMYTNVQNYNNYHH